MARIEDLKELEGWWSPSEAGRVLKTSGQWVTHLARTGQVRGIKTSLGWLVNPDDIQNLAEDRKRKKRAEQQKNRRRQQKQLQLA